jgi:hypothetical protein
MTQKELSERGPGWQRLVDRYKEVSDHRAKKLVKRLVEIKDMQKTLYEEADGIIDILVMGNRISETIDIDDNTAYAVVDRYADANKVFRAVAMPRYELKELK